MSADSCNQLMAFDTPGGFDVICQISAVITQTASSSAGDCNSFGNVTFFFSTDVACSDTFNRYSFILPSLSFSSSPGIPVTQSSVIQRTVKGFFLPTTSQITAYYVNSPGCDTTEALVNEITVVCYP